MAKSKSKNIQILTKAHLSDQVRYDNFAHKADFELLCRLLPNRDRERLEIEDIGNPQMRQQGLVYVFVISGFIFKIGHTITDIKSRVQSYNCGKQEYRINGTCSTTNYFVLQSILRIGEVVDVYALFPQVPKYTVFGKTYQDGLPPSKRAEKVILKQFEERYHKKPVGCSHT